MAGKTLKSSKSALYISEVSAEGESASSTETQIVCAGSTTISIEADVETWNCIGSDTKNKEVTGYDWKLDFDGKMRSDGKKTYDSLIEKLKSGSEICIKAFLDVTGKNKTVGETETNESTYGYGGNGVIKSVNMSMSAPGIWEISVSIEGVGELESYPKKQSNGTADNA